LIKIVEFIEKSLPRQRHRRCFAVGSPAATLPSIATTVEAATEEVAEEAPVN